MEYSPKYKYFKMNTTWNLVKSWQKICQCTLEENDETGCNTAPCWLDDFAPSSCHRKCNSPPCLCWECSARDPHNAVSTRTSHWIKKK